MLCWTCHGLRVSLGGFHLTLSFSFLHQASDLDFWTTLPVSFSSFSVLFRIMYHFPPPSSFLADGLSSYNTWKIEAIRWKLHPLTSSTNKLPTSVHMISSLFPVSSIECHSFYLNSISSPGTLDLTPSALLRISVSLFLLAFVLILLMAT